MIKIFFNILFFLVVSVINSNCQTKIKCNLLFQETKVEENTFYNGGYPLVKIGKDTLCEYGKICLL
jgi:hypothetical protein